MKMRIRTQKIEVSLRKSNMLMINITPGFEDYQPVKREIPVSYLG